MKRQNLNPLIVAHQGGNTSRRLRAASDAGADYAEADVWLSNGRLEVRHGRIGAGRVLRMHKDRLVLSEILAEDVSCGLLLDLKGTNEELSVALCKAIVSAKATSRVAVCGEWEHLDRLAELLPSVPLFYTVDSAVRLEALRLRLDQRKIAALSIDRHLVRSSLVSDLRRAGVETLIAWTVKTEAEAYDLLGCGVDGLTIDSLALVSSIRRSESVLGTRPPRQRGRR